MTTEHKAEGWLNQSACILGDWIDKKEAEQQDRIHYGCAWHIRGDKVFHVCSEQKREWEIK